MDSLTTLAYLKPTTVENLQRLRKFYEDVYIRGQEATVNVSNVDNIIGDTLTPKTARRLLALLVSVVSEGAESTNLRSKLTPAAKTALELLVFFIRNDDEFRNALEKWEASSLMRELKLSIHARDEDPAHRALAREAAQLLVEQFPKLASWIAVDDEEEVEERARGEALVTPEGQKQPVSGASSGAAAAAEAGDGQHEVELKRPAPRQALRQSKPPPEEKLPPTGLYYDTDVSVLVELFNTNLETGLDDAALPARYERYGENKLPEPPPPSPIKMLFKQLKDFMVLTLLVVAIVSFGLQDYIEGVVLVLVVAANVTIGFVQEFKAERALQALKSLGVSTATVLRSGIQLDVESHTLVPGDVVLLEEGDAVPADLRLFEAVNLDVIEAVLTGEAVPVTKTVAAIRKAGLTVGDRTNMAFMSTAVARGRGKGIVVATAIKTEIGQISQALTKPVQRKTLLQQRLSRLGKILVAISIVLCVVVVGIVFLWTWSRTGTIVGDDVLEIIKVGISLAVSVIPEGLVAVTTVTMAVSVQRMAARNAVVRELPAVETVGSLTTICSDKTGTLTEGKMTAQELFAGGHFYTFSGGGIEPTGTITVSAHEKAAAAAADKDKAAASAAASAAATPASSSGSSSVVSTEALPDPLAVALLGCSLCNNSTIFLDPETKRWTSTGDPTEVALTVAAHKAGMAKSELPGYKFIAEIPFDSDRKRMVVVTEAPTEGRKVAIPIGSGAEANYSAVVLAKGAPEAIISICNRRLSRTGAVKAMDEKGISRLEQHNASMALKGMRVLALAYSVLDDKRTAELQAFEERKRSGTADPADVHLSTTGLSQSKRKQPKNPLEAVERDLVFVALVGLIDPPRAAVKDAVANCKNAGIRVCMITGDHPRTAFAIAVQLGIIGPADEHQVAKGSELDSLGTGQLSGLEPFPTVFARVSPANKLKIVSALQLRGEVVAMTGDGVNDAPAIKNADVGIAMGRTATDLTKESADIILTDDNFTTIVAAVKEGRRTYDNIRKFVMYLLACNSAEIYTMFIAAVANLPIPFTPVMILWANLIADIPPALALGIDPAQSDVLDRKPRNPKTGVFTRRILFMLIFYGFSMSSITIALYCIAMFVEDYDQDIPEEERYHPDRVTHAKTLAFIGLTSIQLFHAFSARWSKTIFRRDIFNNRWLVGAYLLSMGLLVFGDYVPGLNTILNQQPLTGRDWGKIAACLAIHLLFVEIYKFVYRRTGRRKRQQTALLFYDDA